MRLPLTLLLAISCYSIFGQSISGETELAGFILGQYRAAVSRELGPPIETIRYDDGWIYEFHKIKPDTSVYVLCKYASEDTIRLRSIQLNGHRFDEMHAFKGLKLGDPKEKIDKVLGTDYERTDTIDNPSVIVYFFRNKNYSIEIDEQGRLYGIQISGDVLFNAPKEPVADFAVFKNAVISRNIDSLLVYLAPDAEFYKGNKILTYSGGARNEFKNPNGSIYRVLLGNRQSVWEALNIEKSEESLELRFIADKKTISTTVVKFYKSKILEEIVYSAHAGKWKVWEIRFRE